MFEDLLFDAVIGMSVVVISSLGVLIALKVKRKKAARSPPKTDQADNPTDQKP